MTRNNGKVVGIVGSLMLALIVLGLRSAAAAPPTPPFKLTAFAINLGSNRPAATAGTVEISIERLSTEQERNELLSSLQKGQDNLLKALHENPRVGYIRTPDSIGWDLHYAHVTPTPDGGTRIFLATDRRINYWEAFSNTRSLDYPFTLIEIHLGPDGKGEGKMSIATKVVPDANGKLLRLEDFSIEPTRLQNIQVAKK